jgi:hypothetical protein
LQASLGMQKPRPGGPAGASRKLRGLWLREKSLPRKHHAALKMLPVCHRGAAMLVGYVKKAAPCRTIWNAPHLRLFE